MHDRLNLCADRRLDEYKLFTLIICGEAPFDKDGRISGFFDVECLAKLTDENESLYFYYKYSRLVLRISSIFVIGSKSRTVLHILTLHRRDMGCCEIPRTDRLTDSCGIRLVAVIFPSP